MSSGARNFSTADFTSEKSRHSVAAASVPRFPCRFLGARFEHEVRVVAALNCLNIREVNDVGPDYLVLPD